MGSILEPPAIAGPLNGPCQRFAVFRFNNLRGSLFLFEYRTFEKMKTRI